MLALMILVITGIGCSSGSIVSIAAKPPLDRATADRLVQGQVLETLRCNIQSAFTDFDKCPICPEVAGVGMQNRQTQNSYRQLMQNGVLICDSEQRCQPGPGSNGTPDLTKLIIPAGNLVASSVTSIAETGEGTAVAPVLVTFQPFTVYAQNQAAFDQIDLGMMGQRAVRDRKQRNSAQATFRRYDDGWHLETIQ